jgi:Zn-finger nucleic acid-binding protein
MTLDTCPVCFGVWLDAGEIDALGDAEIDPAFLKTLVGQSANRMCPRGHGFMHEHILPGLLRSPVDRCPRCKGLWLDGDERHTLARSTTREGQEDQAVQMARRGLIWAAQLLTHLPIEVENPARGTPWAVYGLCGLLVGMYILSVEGVVFAREWAMVAGRLSTEPVHAYTLFTHAFFHADWFHLLGNLYFLYVFGDNVEHLFGRRRFLLLYLGGALIGGACRRCCRSATGTPVIGASGCDRRRHRGLPVDLPTRAPAADDPVHVHSAQDPRVGLPRGVDRLPDRSWRSSPTPCSSRGSPTSAASSTASR